jgi:hypothetical protein
MTGWFERVAERYLGIRGLEFRPRPRFGDKIWLASALPLLDMAVLLVDLYIDLRFDTFGFGTAAEDPEAWRRISVVTSVMETFLTTLSVGVLFLLGLGRWERWEGSWMLLIGAACVAAAMAFAIAAVATAAIGFEEAFDLRSFTWSAWAARLALLAFGYLFVAHRALTRTMQQPRVRRYRRRPPNRRPNQESTER